jgi:fatty acid desaturase
MPRFRLDPFFLTKYFLIHPAICLAIILSFSYFNLTPQIDLPFSPFFLLPFSLIIGIKLPAIMHNCFHYNLKRFNFLAGELTSFFVLMSLGIMSINHAFHHAYADTEKDPHNTEGKRFLSS